MAQAGNPVSTVSQSSACVDCRPITRPGQYVVQDLDKMEAISQPLYAYQTYPTAGANTLAFFQNPASGTTTREDTNMELAGQLPVPQAFLIEGIGIDFLSGTTSAPPVIFGTQAATGQANDMFGVLRRGNLNLIIGSKNYLQISPLMALPPRSHFGANFGASDGGANAATNQQLRMNVGFAQGPVYRNNPLLIQSGQNFRVEINFPGGAVALPSGDALARIGVILYGTLYRPPQ